MKLDELKQSVTVPYVSVNTRQNKHLNKQPYMVYANLCEQGTQLVNFVFTFCQVLPQFSVSFSNNLKREILGKVRGKKIKKHLWGCSKCLPILCEL